MRYATCVACEEKCPPYDRICEPCWLAGVRPADVAAARAEAAQAATVDARVERVAVGDLVRVGADRFDEVTAVVREPGEVVRLGLRHPHTGLVVDAPRRVGQRVRVVRAAKRLA